MKNVIIKYHVLGLILISFFYSINLSASHLIGADITYKEIDTNTGKYRITVRLYRDCAGASMGAAQLRVRTGTSNYTIPMDVGSITEVTPICLPPDVSVKPTTNCPSGSPVLFKGVMEHLFTKDVILGKNSGWALVGVYDFCRNNALSTINPTCEGLWVQAVINTNYRNSSPVFTTKPIPYWCRLKENTYNHGTLDTSDKYLITLPNGVTTVRDSLGYRLYTPFTNEAANVNNAVNYGNPGVNFITPLNQTNFLYTTTGVTVDPRTGSITCTPSIQQDAIMAMSVQEWRAVPNGNGYSRVLVGYVCRDIQFTVGNTCDPIHMPGLLSDSTKNATIISSNTISTEVGRKNVKTSFLIIGAQNQSLKTKVSVSPSSSLFQNFNYSQIIKSGGGIDTLIGSITIDSVVAAGEDKFTIELYYCSPIGLRQNQFYSVKLQSIFGTCNSVGDSAVLSNLNINRVTISGGLNNIDNITPCNSHTGSQGTGTGVFGRYSNFTNTTVPKTKLIKGSTFNLAITDTACMSGSHYYTKAVFIDWNKNNDFTDLGERYNVSTSPFNLPSENINITVPVNAPLGLIKMRIVTRIDTPASNLNPCGPSLNISKNQGETEDYELDIVEDYRDCKLYKKLSYLQVGDKFHFFSSGPNAVHSPYTVSYSWTFNNGQTSNVKNPVLDSLPHGKLNWAKLVICVDSASINICCDSSRIDSISNCKNSCSISRVNDTLIANPIGGIAPYSYTWSNAASNQSIITNSAGNYFVYVTDSLGCTSECSFSYLIAVNCTSPNIATVQVGLPTIFPAGGICSGACYPNLFNTVSTGRSSANRYIYTAADLKSSGFNRGTIKSIAFNITEVNTSLFDTFEIRIGSTGILNASSISSGLTTVYKNTTTVTAGWNKFVFSAPFVWDGVSNIIIEAHTQNNSAMLSGNKIRCFNVISGNRAAYKVSNTIGVKAENEVGSYVSVAGVANLPSLQLEYCSDTQSCANYRNFTWNRIGNNYTFYTSPNIPMGYFPTYNWTFGNGQWDTIAQPSVNFNANSSYTVKLKYCLRDSAKNIICCDSILKVVQTPNQNVSISCNIQPSFTWTGLSNGVVNFNDATFSPNGQMFTYHWTFGDGTSSNQKNPTKVYSSNGNKYVCLKVKKWLNNNSLYCEDTVCKIVVVSNIIPCNRLEPEFIYTSLGNGIYTFQNATDMSNFTLISASYQIIPLGVTINSPNATRTFTSSGIYNIVFTITATDILSGATCTKTTWKSIFVNMNQCGCFKARNLVNVMNKFANFTNTSTCVDTNTKYLYKFGNGDTSTNPNSSYTYPLPGLYRTVMYISRTLNGVTCKDSFVRILQVTTTHPCKDSGYTVYYNYSCPSFINPVCGCDSITYRNYCVASRAGVKQYTLGPCKNDTTYVKLCGYVINDLNKDCIRDTNDIPIKSIAIKVNTTPVSYAYTNASGYYQIYLAKGTYTLTQQLGFTNPAIDQLCPAAGASITVNANAGGTFCNNHFYDTMSICPDLSVSIARFTPIVPGFTSIKHLSYSNRGATTIPGVVLKYRFLSSLSVNSFTTPAYTVSGNIITWNLGSMPPYSSGSKNVSFDVPVSLPLGTAVIDSVWIEPSTGDCNLSNNYATFPDTCVGSYDPNDKAASPANNIDTGVKVIDYHIRFQNTGTAPAHNVRIEDVIDNNFEKASLKVHDYSHAMYHYFDDNGRLYFEFPNIMLPDSGTDYEASQGYVTYSVHLKKGLPVGTKLKNTAEIYFDFNEPIITNTTVNTITLKSTNAIHISERGINLEVYPNPTKNIATIKTVLAKNSLISYSLYDIQGRVILRKNAVIKSAGLYTEDINLEALKTGIYVLSLKIEGQETSLKLIKE
jgi:uncharacterized repeat protein (TIGR01451 family)